MTVPATNAGSAETGWRYMYNAATTTEALEVDNVFTINAFLFDDVADGTESLAPEMPNNPDMEFMTPESMLGIPE